MAFPAIGIITAKFVRFKGSVNLAIFFKRFDCCFKYLEISGSALQSLNVFQKSARISKRIHLSDANNIVKLRRVFCLFYPALSCTLYCSRGFFIGSTGDNPATSHFLYQVENDFAFFCFPVNNNRCHLCKCLCKNNHFS